MLRNPLILGRKSRARIAEKEHAVGLFNRELRLSGHRLDDAFAAHGLKAARIDHDIGPGTHAPLTLLTVASKTGKIRHDGVSAAGEPIKESRLADIRPAHESDDWKHEKKMGFKKIKKAAPGTLSTQRGASGGRRLWNSAAFKRESYSPPSTT